MIEKFKGTRTVNLLIRKYGHQPRVIRLNYQEPDIVEHWVRSTVSPFQSRTEERDHVCSVEIREQIGKTTNYVRSIPFYGISPDEVKNLLNEKL